jgi:hypothetical protein
MELDLSILTANFRRLQYWLGERGPAVHIVEFGTFSELWCQAQFYRVAAQDCNDYLHAFTCLWRRHLERGEEFEIGAAHLELFLASFGADPNWGTKTVFAQLTEADWLKETSLVTSAIRQEIAKVRSGKLLVQGKPFAIPTGPFDLHNSDTYWGIFEDGKRVPDDTAYEFLGPGAVQEGIAIRQKWNDQELFVKTASEYILFTWATGA